VLLLAIALLVAIVRWANAQETGAQKEMLHLEAEIILKNMHAEAWQKCASEKSYSAKASCWAVERAVHESIMDNFYKTSK
jgi:hypothetical protein